MRAEHQPLSDSREWLRGLPKAEIHLHLEGTVTPATLVTLSQRHDKTPLTLEDAERLYNYSDFLHFLATFTMVCDRLQTPDDYTLITREMIKDLAAQGVVHAEVYLTWGAALKISTRLAFNQVMDAIEAARISAEKELGITVLWIIDAARQWGAEECGKVFDQAARWKESYPSIIGIGIGGDEVRGPCHLFKEVYQQAKSRGLRLTAHAGESTGPIEGPRSIRDALDIGAERIGHGTCAAYDAKLMTVLAEQQTPIEVSITSNVKTGVCQSVEQHPFKLYLENGLMVTINSDDPAMFGSHLLDEYVLVRDKFALSSRQMIGLAANSIRASFLSEERKTAILAQIEAYGLGDG